MWKRQRQAIAWHGKWVWQRIGKLRELLGRVAVKRELVQADSRRNATRARFWAALREGQREAEAQCSRQDP